MQRVSIGRAIVRDPRIFLMDEPLSNLDAKLRESLRVELQHIQKTRHSTTLYVTHDQVEALTLADRIAVLRNGQIVQLGTAEDIYDRPANTFVAQLVGTPRINLLRSTYTDGQVQIGGSGVKLPIAPNHNGQLPATLTLGIRPEHVAPASDGEFSGQLALIEPLGAETVLYITLGEQSILSMVSGISGYRIGEHVRFNIAHDHLHFFGREGVRLSA
jgi:ABC-type sugar transport system ATPase subunit